MNHYKKSNLKNKKGNKKNRSIFKDTTFTFMCEPAVAGSAGES